MEMEKLAGDTYGFVSADIQDLNSLATMAREEGKCLSMEHFMPVRSKVREVMVEVSGPRHPQATRSDIGGLDVLKLKLGQAV